MRNYFVCVFLIIIAIVSASCKKKMESCPIFFPVKPDAKLSFMSYVTTPQNEILYPFEYFDRRYAYTDTIAARLIHYYIEKNKKSSFLTDDSCTIWHRTSVDLSALALSCGFAYRDSVHLVFWKPVIKVNKGVNTRWSFKIDTTFYGLAADGAEHLLHYKFSGSAQYKGWSEVIVPENRTRRLKVRHVQWNPIQYLLYDRTTNDTLYSHQGTASDYFEPELGLVRSISDYDVTWKGKPMASRKSTWELYQVLIPSQ